MLLHALLLFLLMLLLNLFLLLLLLCRWWLPTTHTHICFLYSLHTLTPSLLPLFPLQQTSMSIIALLISCSSWLCSSVARDWSVSMCRGSVARVCRNVGGRSGEA